MGIQLPVTEDRISDAGASFVLQSKGEWWHAGFHLTTAIVGPTILTLPYAFRGLGWGLGFFCLTIMAVVTFYSYFLMSKVLDHCEKAGRRHIRFRELAADVLGSGWMFYFVIFIQTAINTGVGIGAILLSGQCLQIIYSNLYPNGSMKLYEFIAIVTGVMIILSQLPTFHSLRHVSLASLLLSLGYAFLIIAACIIAAMSKEAPERDVIFVTFYAIAASGYWVFGNRATSNILLSLTPDTGPPLAPTWILGLAVIFVLLQLLAIGLVYSQVAYEIMEKQSADMKKGMFSKRNLIPRLILRSIYMIICGFFAAMLPFFGDISAVVGAICFIPLDFVLPMLLYNITHNPPKSSLTYSINLAIIVVFTGVGLLGSFSSIRKLVLDASKFKLFSNDVVD
ncbi:putative GABA transporter 2 [Cucurbita argyrosperma subsp. argyrosperma]|nr:putative GABA transporter 2 [Cucurbita argyrosperma subsp. argyrosperma]